MKSIFLILAIFTWSVGLAQDAELAFKYFQAQEYDKAVVLYEKLYQTQASKNLFRLYLRSLLGIKNFEKAEELAKSETKENPQDPSYGVELADIYKQTDRKEKGQKLIENLLRNMQDGQFYVHALGNTLVEKGEYDYALLCYDRAREVNKNPNSFRFEKARVYSLMRNYKGLVSEYLDLLEESANYLSVVQSNLQYYLTSDVDNNLGNIIRTQTTERLANKPEVIGYAQILAWLYLQEKKFELALIQIRAIDIRMGGNGDKLNEFAQIALANRAYKVARKAYEYMLNLRPDMPEALQIVAQTGILNAAFLELTTSIAPNTQAAQELAQNLKAFNNSHKAHQIANTTPQLAEVEAFYLHQPDSAIARLLPAIQNRQYSLEQRAKMELLLADIYLTNENPWEAILAYGRVEKENKHNDTGNEAKFRKTKVAYFTGDFEWAKTQLDILKASTSKFIANDAFELSMLIEDNTYGDSIEVPLLRFANAQMLILQRKKNIAIDTLSAIYRDFPSQTIAEHALYQRAQLFDELKLFDKAAQDYQTLFTKYEMSILADNAMFRYALHCEQNLANLPEASKTYQEFMIKHKGSVLMTDARLNYRKLQGDKEQ